MKILYFALFFLVYYLILFGLTRLIRAMAYSAEYRYLHCRILPLLLILFLGAANVYTISYPMELLDKIINAPRLQPILQQFLPSRAFELLYMLLMILGLNLLAVLAALALVGALRLIFRDGGQFTDYREMSLPQKLLRFPWALTVPFYEEQENGNAGLNNRGFVFGIWVDGIRLVLNVLTVVVPVTIGISILWGNGAWNERMLGVSKAWYLMPMAASLLFQQLHLMLEGQYDDRVGSFGTTEIRQTQAGDLRQLYEAYPEIFQNSGALMLHAATGDPRYTRGGLGGSDPANRQLEDCSQPDALKVICTQVRRSGARQTEAYQNALVELLNGKSVNICDDSRGEFLPVLAAYLNFYLAQGKTALVLCRDAETAQKMRKALETQMRKLNDIYSMWNIRTLEGAEDNSRLSILVCSADDFLNHSICSKRRDFVEDLFCTVLLNGEDIFSRDSIRLEQLFSQLRKLETMQQYILFSEVNNDALRTALEQVCKQEVHPFHNDRLMPDTYILAWREESYYKLQQYLGIGNSLSPYMGTALPLALVAAHLDLPQIYLLTHPSRGDGTFNDAMNMSSREVMHFVSQNANLKSIIRYDPEEALVKQALPVLITYDTDYNFLNALWRQLRKSGTRQTLLHVVSPPYMLREYFASNFQDLLLKNNEFDAMITYRLGMKVSQMAVLLTTLCDDGMTEQEVKEKSKEFGWNYASVEEILADCLRVVLTREEMHSIHECFRFEEEKHFVETENRFAVTTRIRLTDSTICRRIQEKISCANLVTREDQQYPLPILRSNVHNYYLRGQLACFNGHLYQIRSVNGGNVYAEQIMPQDVPGYYPISDLKLENRRVVTPGVHSGFLDMNICTCDATRNIWGYWSSNRGNCFGGNCNALVNDLRDPENRPLQDRFEGIGVLELRIRRSTLGARAEEAARLLAYMLSELSKTLFPANWQNLCVATGEGYDAQLYDRVLSQGKDSALGDMVSSVIPVLTERLCSDEAYVTVYAAELSGVEYGMVQMLNSRFQTVLRMLREYLQWYFTPIPAEADPEMAAAPVAVQGTYLNFGADAMPDVFDAEGVLALLRKLITEEEEVRTGGEVVVTAQEHCTFCERPVVCYQQFQDGRRMCNQCADHQITQKEEIRTLFRDTHQWVMETYNVQLPRNMHVRFQSAQAIMRATGVTEGRVLGFYAPASRSMWLEARGPRVAMQATLIHELTHAWQFTDRTFSDLLDRVLRRYPRNQRQQIRLMLVEGHAVFVEIHAMQRRNEVDYARHLQHAYANRQDVYGQGYRLVDGYIRELENEGSHITPFVAMTRLLQAIVNGEVTLE